MAVANKVRSPALFTRHGLIPAKLQWHVYTSTLITLLYVLVGVVSAADVPHAMLRTRNLQNAIRHDKLRRRSGMSMGISNMCKGDKGDGK